MFVFVREKNKRTKIKDSPLEGNASLVFLSNMINETPMHPHTIVSGNPSS